MHAYQPHEAPSPEQQRFIAEELRHYFAKIDEKTKDIPEDEQEEIIDEAAGNGTRESTSTGDC